MCSLKGALSPHLTMSESQLTELKTTTTHDYNIIIPSEMYAINHT
jgi:hypothetical protein